MNKDEVFLLEAGVSPTLRGFRYIPAAVKYIRENPEAIKSRMTKEVYPEVAKQFNTSASKVERGIRHAIESAMKTMIPGRMADLEAKYGNGLTAVLCDPFKGKPTNSTLITWMAMALPGMGKERMT